mmetsp:Transcript_6051/g.13382  ORF Transcript_6051/g.13382 Transcript_6051/m.13382 type:complete len:352 (-) Transcript_6051:821-1876(-)
MWSRTSDIPQWGTSCGGTPQRSEAPRSRYHTRRNPQLDTSSHISVPCKSASTPHRIEESRTSTCTVECTHLRGVHNNGQEQQPLELRSWEPCSLLCSLQCSMTGKSPECNPEGRSMADTSQLPKSRKRRLAALPARRRRRLSWVPAVATLGAVAVAATAAAELVLAVAAAANLAAAAAAPSAAVTASADVAAALASAVAASNPALSSKRHQRHGLLCSALASLRLPLEHFQSASAASDPARSSKHAAAPLDQRRLCLYNAPASPLLPLEQLLQSPNPAALSSLRAALHAKHSRVAVQRPPEGRWWLSCGAQLQVEKTCLGPSAGRAASLPPPSLSSARELLAVAESRLAVL